MVDENENIDKRNSIKALEKILEERNKIKDEITTCEWCGMTYPKGGWMYYKLRVRNMDIKMLVEDIRKGIEDNDFEEHIICSDCYDHLEKCKEC